MIDAVPSPLRLFYEQGYRKALETGEPWSYNYECSSPSLYREYSMLVHPFQDLDGLVVVNSLCIERAHSPGVPVPSDSPGNYFGELGIVTMCCHCRRTQRAGQPTVWDWVPSWVAAPPARVSHGICQTCLGLYYGVPGQNTRN